MSPLRRFPALASVGLFALGWALACAEGGKDTGDEGEFDKTFEVDCLGMGLGIPLGGQRITKTRYSDRCFGSISDTTWGGDLELWTGANFGVQNGMALTIEFGGHTYVAESGKIHVDWTEQLPNGDSVYAEGFYDVVATDENGDQVRLHGKMDWCDFARSQDCPYRPTQGDLTKEVRFEIPDNYGGDEGTYASECRVLIDTAAEAVQVDMQLGMLNGHNTAMSWLDCEYPVFAFDRFTFRAAGVAGPGTYDYAIQAVEDPANPGVALGLPGFVFTVPELFYGQTCLLSQYQLEVRDSITGEPWSPVMVPAASDTQCTFTIEESPGRFLLDCANAEKFRFPDQPIATVGALHLDADCDVRYR